MILLLILILTSNIVTVAVAVSVAGRAKREGWPIAATHGTAADFK